jgi:hypothetical protein
MRRIKWRICENIYIVVTASAICGVKSEHPMLKPNRKHEESVTSYKSFIYVGNLFADKGDSDERNVQTRLATRIS